MIQSLTLAQQTLLHRCDGGLRLWETGAEREKLIVELRALASLGLIAFSEDAGYELTAQGEAWLIEASR